MSTESKHEYDWPQSHTLYVVLQGEFVLYHQAVADNPDHDTLRILAPDVPGHKYKAGPWCQDWRSARDLPKHLHLRNALGDHKQSVGSKQVHTPRSIPEHNTDIIMSVGNDTLQADNARLDIRAPMPLAILPGLAETTDSVVITVWDSNGKTSHLTAPNPATLIPILLYKWYGDRHPFLYNREFDQSWFPGGPADFQALHIYASNPIDDEDATHAKCAFRAAAELLDADAEIDWTEPSFRRIFATPPAGLSWAQVNSFFCDIADMNPCEYPVLLRDRVDPSDESLELPFKRQNLFAGHSNNCGPVTGTGG